MKKTGLIAAVSAWLFVCLAPLAQAAPILDQQYLPRITGSTTLGIHNAGFDAAWGQTFTPSVTGLLSEIDMAVAADHPGQIVDMNLFLFPTVGPNAFDASAGAMLTVDHSLIPLGPFFVGPISPSKLLAVDVSSLDFQVVAGQQYVWLLNTPNDENARLYFGCDNSLLHSCNFGNGTTNGYAGGNCVAKHILGPWVGVENFTPSSCVQNGVPQASAAFQVWVTPVPEPASWAMFFAGFALLFVLRRRRRQCFGEGSE